jgi:XTP/dITP diphosphohydrolase
MKLIFVTGNEGKFKTAQEIMNKYDIKLIRRKLKLNEPQHEDIEFIVKSKALESSKKINKPLIVEDSGLFIPSLNNFPGSYTGFILKTIGVEGLLKLLRGNDKRCTFHLSLAYWEPGMNDVKIFKYKDHGCIGSDVSKGSKSNTWSNLFSVYIPKGYNTPLSSMDKKEYKKFKKEWYERTHFKQLAEWLKLR